MQAALETSASPLRVGWDSGGPAREPRGDRASGGRGMLLPASLLDGGRLPVQLPDPTDGSCEGAPAPGVCGLSGQAGKKASPLGS